MSAPPRGSVVIGFVNIPAPQDAVLGMAIDVDGDVLFTVAATGEVLVVRFD